MPLVTFIRLASALALAFLASAVIASEPLATPAGEVILTVSGEIAVTNAEDTAQFDYEMFEELEAVAVQTSTPWTEGPQVFVGVSLKTLVEHVGAEGSKIVATAINDYSIDIPFDDAVVGGALVAYSRNGSPMRVRDKGPLWVIYPFDLDPRYRTETYHSRSIWQLDRLNIIP